MAALLLLPVAIFTTSAAALPPPEATITQPPVIGNSLYRRDIISDIAGDVGSILSGLGSNIPSVVASGIQPYFTGLPTGDQVVSSLSLKTGDIDALPIQVLNIDPYANWTDQGWNVRFHGNVYKQPNVSNETLDKLADDLFIYGTKLSSLLPSQQAQARNLTAEIFVVQQGGVNVSTIHLEPDMTQNSSGVPASNGAIQDINLPYATTPEGDFDVFLPIRSDSLQPGNTTTQIQRLSTHVEGASLGNSTAYLVPDQGLTIISDIDDILRVTKIYEPKEGLLNTFARPFTAWENMPQIYANWASTVPNLHFHYLTTTPEQVTRNYMEFIYATYPGGSFDTRPLNFSDISATLSIRKFLLVKILETFPKRKFILVADTSNSDVMRDYPEMAKEFPSQVQCILLRNTSATDPGDKFPYDTKGFEGIEQSKYMFFVNAADIAQLKIQNGQCYNTSIPQNLTFGTQGLPFGLGSTPAVNGSATKASLGLPSTSVSPAMILGAVVGTLVFLFVL